MPPAPSTARPSKEITEPDGPGRRVLAFLMASVFATPLVATLGAVALPSSLTLSAIPVAAWFASALKRKGWLAFVMAGGLITGILLGHVMEGTEGAAWGSLVGIAAGFFAAWFSLWMLRVIPDRWGNAVGWSLLGIACTLVPLLAAVRLIAGKIDDDESPFIFLAIVYGVFHSMRKGWQQLGFTRPHVLGAIGGWLRYWTSMPALPWVAAFAVSGIVAGSLGPSFQLESQGSRMSIHLLPVSFIWPSSLVSAALLTMTLPRGNPGPLKPIGNLVCGLVVIFCAVHLAGLIRHHASIDDSRVDLRHGLFGSVSIPRGELVLIETGIIRSRRVSSSYPILVTRSGDRHSLRGMPMNHEIREHLRNHWHVAVSPESR